MDRLLKRILLTTLLSYSTASCFAADAYYSIVGDVKTPQTYKVSGDATVGSRQLLAFAEAEAGLGTLYILRDNGRTVAAVDSYGTAHATAETILQDGDRVVVVAHAPVSHRCGNAVVMLNSVPDVLKFDQKTLPTADFLSHLQLPQTLLLDITRLENGIAVSRQLSRSDSIQHCDIIHLQQSLQQAGLAIPASGFSYVTPPSESVTADLTQVLTVSSPEETLLTIPMADNTPILGSDVRGQMELLPAEPIDLATVISEETPEPESQGTIRSASLSSPVSEPTRAATQTASAGSNAIWNTVFVGGLLLAMALIAVGWIKTQNEINSGTQASEENQISESSRPSRENQTEPLNLPPLNDTNELNAAVDDDCPILSAGLDDNDVATEPNILEEPVSTEPSVEVSAAAPTVQSENVVLTESWFDEEAPLELSSGVDSYDLEDTEIEKTEVEYRSDRTVEVAATETTANDDEALTAAEESSKEQTLAEAVVENESVADVDAVPQPQMSDDDLENLIQNRIPIELTTAKLPLRVNLFGEPAGPKRLRIDAAHTEIAPPHMMKKAPAGRTSKPEAATVKAPQSTAPRSAGDGLGHLDRALNYLEEQTDE